METNFAEVEHRAIEYLNHKQWSNAFFCFDQLLENAVAKSLPSERFVGYLLGRSQCSLELKKYEDVIHDCRHIISMLTDDENAYSSRVRRNLVNALFALKRYSEAEQAALEWVVRSDNSSEAKKMLDTVRLVWGMSKEDIPTPVQTLEDQLNQINEDLLFGDRLDSWIATGVREQTRRNRKHPVELVDDEKMGGTLFESSSIENNSIQDFERNSKFLERFNGTGQENGVVYSNAAKFNGEAYDLRTNYQPKVSEVFQERQESRIEKPTELKFPKKTEMRYSCTYCGISFHLENQLRAHCATENHQTVIMSDEGRDWKWRPPPRGFSSECYTLCEAYSDGEGVESSCKYGAQCVEAHGMEELTEWKERFEYRRMKLQRASENKLYGKSYTEQLLERWVQSTNPEKIMRESLDCVVESHDCDLVTTVESKTSNREWTFVLETTSPLQAVALLQDTYRNHFSLKHILVDNGLQQVAFDMEPPNDQEWVSQAQHPISQSMSSKLRHQIKVYFTTNIYGTFRQAVVFDFGLGPVLVKHLCVDVIPVTDCDKVKEIHRELILSSMERWNLTNSIIVEFQSSIGPVQVQGDREREQNLLLSYPAPCPSTFSLTHTTISEKKLTKNNYRARIHELLYVEELARYEQVARYNLTAKLQLASCYLLSPSGVAASTAKYAHNNELFALLQLGTDVSEDTSAGRLILNNCTTVYLSPSKGKDSKTSDEKRTVHEAQIEDKGKNVIYLRLSANTVTGLGLKAETNVKFDVQFQLNRIPYCEWHYAIDHIADFKIIFPDTFLEPIIPWSPKRQWVDIIDKKLNVKQREAVIAITTPTNISLPPILIIGPFGTGKTYTLAQAIKQTLLQDNTRILVCTHSNSAADLYIKDYLHPYVEEGHTEAKPLRIYYHKRWVSTVHSTVQKYCILDQNGSFRLPTLEEILNYRVIVVTLSISMFLSSVGLKKGHFTHILLDEAAQAMECEAIMPLALANTDTRIVLAGDHMQLSPEIFSKFAKERNLHVSLLERLYDHYPGLFACKILLCENYRAHEAIIHFTSELFYEQKLVSKGNQPQHDSLYPLTFFTTRGEDIQDSNSTAFYNNAEVYEVVERVSELRKNWPAAWGAFDEHSIGIMTPYSDQVFRIRSELRKRRMGGISVERVLNVQGKQFRAIFLSTVRTRRTCLANNIGGGERANSGINKLGMDDMDYGFLSNSKLLNTAITRAQSLVAVVGDPVALCSIGRCRKVWERFIQICDENHSLNGITWIHLRNLLDNLELKKTYILNPLAPEFVPRRYQQESYIKIPQSLATFNAAIPPPPIRFSQPPPLFSSPLFPFPLYIPSITQPPPPAFISLRQPIINPSQMWPLGPLTTTPNIFPRPMLQPPIQKPNEEEIRPPPGLVPPRNSGLVHLVQNGHSDLQFVQNASGVTPVNLPSPNMIVPSTNLMGLQDQFNKMNMSSIQPFAMQHPSLVQPFNMRTMVDVNNKHTEAITAQQTQRNNDRSMLEGMLPHNISLEEMMSSQSKQVEWLKFLTDNGGALMGQKFIELLRSQALFKKPTTIQQPPPNVPLQMNVPPPEISNRVPDDLLNILIQQQQTQKQQINHNGFGNPNQVMSHLDSGGTSEDMYKPLSNQFSLGQQQPNIDQIDRTPLYKRQAQPQPNGNIILPINGDRQALSPQYQSMSTYADACRQSPMVEERKNPVDGQFGHDSPCNNPFYNFFN